MIDNDKLRQCFNDVTDSMLIAKGDGLRLAVKIEKFINTKCKEFKQKYKRNYGNYLTPQEQNSQWAA